jgi:hypothetical protein
MAIRRLPMRWILGVRLVVALLVLTGPASATIRRTPGSWLFGPKTVWTDGTVNPTFHPLGDPMASRGLINARVAIEMSEDTSGLCKIRPALRYGNDGVSWDASGAIDTTYRTSAGITYGTTYVDLTAVATTRPWIQFGVEVANESGSAVNICNATLLVEPKEQ